MPSGFADFLVDTNILIYTFDHSEVQKRVRATEVIARLNSSIKGALSTQVVGELLSVALRKERLGLERREALELGRRLLGGWHVLGVSAEVVFGAIEGVERYQLSYYDAQLWASARIHAIPTILTEDGTHGQTLEGVTFQNPLRLDFDLDSLGPPVS